MAQVIIKPLQYYKENKREFNKNKYNRIVKKYISKIYIGDMSYLFHKYDPLSIQDFADKYFADYEGNDFNNITHIGSKKQGRSYEQFLKLSEALCKECKGSKVEDCFDNLICHAIVETYQGQHREQIVINKLKECEDLEIVQMDGFMDSEFGVDILVKNKKSNNRHYIQIKPISTFLGNNNLSLVDDRKNFFEKENKLFELQRKMNLQPRPIEYMCYKENDDGSIQWLTSTYRKRFLLSELCDNDGKSKLIYNNCIFTML